MTYLRCLLICPHSTRQLLVITLVRGWGGQVLYSFQRETWPQDTYLIAMNP